MPEKFLARFVVITLASLVMAANAQDIRDKVAAPASVMKVSEIIDPDSNIYGVPYGTTEDQFIAQFGNPMGYVRLPGNMTGMIYGRTHCFLFVGGKLAGLRISWNLLDWKLMESVAPSTMFDDTKWRLPAGIKKDMSLPEVKQILGDRLVSPRQYRWSFATERATVDLDFMRISSQGQQDDALKVSGVYITPR